ncbi:HlyD family secretion protein [Facilibium subflavum]|uniref:HlyD family secretion protein n=1 Tax=Facilibium subflavum TaxID=2219058 RepID=UPI000E651019|nr:HlyD family efflux transporter periplasmic adaptor subunit [Facilibium subflavum]
MSLHFKKPQKSRQSNNVNYQHKKNISKWRWYFIVIIILSPLIYLAWVLINTHWFITAKGVLQFDVYTIRAPESAYIKNMYVSLGDTVAPQQTLVILSSPSLEKEFQLIKTQLSKLKESKALFQNKKQLAYLKKLRQKAQQFVDDSGDYYQRLQKYHNRGMLSILDLQKAYNDLHEARQSLINIDNLIAQNQSTYKRDTENSYLQDIRALEVRLKTLETKLEKLTIQWPQKAFIQQIYAKQGEFVMKGQALMMLSTRNNLHIRAYLDAKYLPYVYAEKKVTIYFPDNKKFAGEITQTPTFSHIDNTQVNIFKSQDRKIILIVKPTEKIPKGYQIYGLPVFIDIDRS